MDNKKDDKYYIEKAIENINIIINYTKNKSYEEFISDGVSLDATMFRMVQMVENLNHISKEYREIRKDIKWGLIIGFRNGIVHEYGRTDY